MDFSLTEDQAVIAELAQKIFRDAVSDSYLAGQPANPDPDLWRVLAGTGLISTGFSEAAGGSGMGFIAECLVVREMARVLAPVPLLETLLAGGALDHSGNPNALADVGLGKGHLTLSLGDGLVLNGDTVSGSLPSVSYVVGASCVVCIAQDKLLAFDPAAPGAALTAESLSNGRPAASIDLDQVAVSHLGGQEAIDRLRQRQQVMTSMMQLAVAEEALRRTAVYTSERQQFGKPLAAFQAVAHRAADAYIDIEALRSVVDGAMWLLDQNRDAVLQAGAARWWACEVSHRVSHTAQHLHGGIGADLEYPIHRFFLWSKQLEFDLAGAGTQLAAMGEHLATHPTSGITL